MVAELTTRTLQWARVRRTLADAAAVCAMLHVGYEQSSRRRKTPETTPPLRGERFEY